MSTAISDGLFSVGRIIIGMVFVILCMISLTHWEENISFLTSRGVPYGFVALAVGNAWGIVCGLCLIFCFASRLAAFSLVFFDCVVAFVFFDFWDYSGSESFSLFLQLLCVIANIGALAMVAAVKAK